MSSFLLIKLWVLADRFKVRYLQVMIIEMLQEQLRSSPNSLTPVRLGFVFRRTPYGSTLRSWHIDAFAADYSLSRTPSNHFGYWDYDALRELIMVLCMQSLPNGEVLQRNRRDYACSYHVHAENEDLPSTLTPRGTRYSPYRTDMRPLLSRGVFNYDQWYWSYANAEAKTDVALNAFHTITAQPEYAKKSLEELRIEDYDLGLLGPMGVREQRHACNGMFLADEMSEEQAGARTTGL